MALHKQHTAWKLPKYGVFSGPFFPVFGRKNQTRKNSVFGHFSCSSKTVLGVISCCYHSQAIYTDLFTLKGALLIFAGDLCLTRFIPFRCLQSSIYFNSVIFCKNTMLYIMVKKLAKTVYQRVLKLETVGKILWLRYLLLSPLIKLSMLCLHIRWPTFLWMKKKP